MAEENKGLGKLLRIIKSGNKREGGVKTASTNTDKAMMGGVEAFLGNIEGVLAQTVGSIVCGQDNLKTFAEVSNKIKAKNPLIENVEKQTGSLDELKDIAVLIKKNKDNIATMFKDINATPLILKLMTDTIEDNKKYRMEKDKEWKKFSNLFGKDSKFEQALDKVLKATYGDTLDAIKEKVEGIDSEDNKKKNAAQTISITGLDTSTTKSLNELVDSVTKIKDNNVKTLESLLVALTIVAAFSANGDLKKSYDSFTILNKDFFDPKSGVLFQIVENLGQIPNDVSGRAKAGIETMNELGKVLDVLNKTGDIGFTGILMANIVLSMASSLIFGKRGSANMLVKQLDGFGPVPDGVLKTITELDEVVKHIGNIGSPRNLLGVMSAAYIFGIGALIFNKKGPANIFIKSLKELPNVTKPMITSFGNLDELVKIIGNIGDPKNAAKVYLASIVLTYMWLMFSSKGPVKALINNLKDVKVSSDVINSAENLNLLIGEICAIGKNSIKDAFKAKLIISKLAAILQDKDGIQALVTSLKRLQVSGDMKGRATIIKGIIEEIYAVSQFSVKDLMKLPYIFSSSAKGMKSFQAFYQILSGLDVNQEDIATIENIQTIFGRLIGLARVKKQISKSKEALDIANSELSPVLKQVVEEFAKLGDLSKEKQETIVALCNYIGTVVEISKVDSSRVKGGIKSFDLISTQMIPAIQNIINAIAGMNMNGAQKNTLEISQTLGIINNFPFESIDKIKESIESLKELVKEIDSIQELQDKLKTYKTALSEIEQVFDQTNQVAVKADSAAASTKKIDKGLNDVNKTAVDSGNKSKNAKRATISLGEVAKFVMMSAIVMLLGGMIITKYPELISGAMQFGVVLMAFIALILAPFTLMSVICKGGLKTVQGFSKLILTCTIVMMIGGLFMMMGGGKMVQSALAFGVVLGMFMTLVIMPFLVFSLLQVCVGNSIKAFTKFMLVCTIVMMVGALFMMMGNGKWVSHALAFGLVLMMFETLVVLPFLVFAILRGSVEKSIVHFTAFVLVCTIVMLIGALFIDRKYAEKVLAFAKLMATFELAVIMPILLLKLLIQDAWKTMLALTLFVVVSAACMMIGASWMNGKRAAMAMAFAALLALFEVAVIAPTLLLKKMVKDAMFVMLGLAAFVAVSAAVLMTGALFIEKHGSSSIIQYAIILGLFVAAMGTVFGLLGQFKAKILEGTTVGLWLSAAVAALSLSMMMVHTCIEMAKGWKLIEDVGILLIATGLISAVFAIIGIPAVAAFVALGGAVAVLIGVALTSLSIGFMLLHVLVSKNPAADAIKLGLAITALLIPFGLMGVLSPLLFFGSIVGTMLGVALTSLSIGFMLLHILVSKDVAKDAGLLALAILATMVPFTLLGVLSPLIALGSIVAVAMSIAIGLLSLSFALVHAIVSKDVLKDMGILSAAIGLVSVVFGLIGVISPLVALGVIVGAAMSLAIGLLVGAFALVHLIAKNDIVGDVQKLNQAMGEVVKLCLSLMPLTIAVPLAMIPAALLVPLARLLSASLLAIGGSMLIINKVGNFNANKIKTMISDFISITNVCPGIFKYAVIMTKIARLNSLGFAISRLAYRLGGTVQFISDLKVATKWNSDGDPIKFKQLKESDFISAANSIKTILTTLAGAIVETYNNYPELFGDKAEEILFRVKRLAYTEAYMIAYLATSLQSYAQLLIPTKWNSDGDPIKFRTMKEADFEAAANGISKVLTTLGKSIVDTYTLYPELFGDNAEDILEKVQALAMAEGEMISTLSQGLISYAQILIPTKWNKNGVAVKFRQMREDEFGQAATNIGKVMTTMAIAIRCAWTGEGNKDLGFAANPYGGLKSISSGGWFGTSIGEIIEQLAPMGNLVANMADGIQHYAALTIPDKWNKDGKPVHFMNVTNAGEFFGEAGKNIGLVLTTMASSVAQAYKTMNSASWFDSVDEIIEAVSPIGELISNTAEGIQNYANLKVPTYWKDGKAVSFAKMTPEDFESAATNIGTVLTLISGAVAMTWSGQDFSVVANRQTLTFKGNGKGLKNEFDTDEFKEIMEGFSSVGTLISSIAEGIQNYANLRIPTRWKYGKPVKYRDLTPDDFTAAGQNISRVLFATLFGDGNSVDTATGGIIGAWNKLEEMDLEDDLEEIMEALLPVGDFISSMSESIHNYAELLIPTHWEDGKAVKYRPMKPADFTNAGKGISRILSCMVTAVAGFSTEHPELFEDGEDSQFAQTVAALCGLGEMIANIAEGVNAYAAGTIPIEWDKEGKPINFKSIGEKEYKEAAKNIGEVLAVLGKSVIDFADTHPEYFNVTDEQSKFKVAIDSVKDMGKLIKDISDGVQTYANGGIPVYGKDGKILRYDKFPDDYFDKAGANIGKIISCVGNAVVNFYNSPQFKKFTDKHGDFKEAMEAVTKIGTAVKNVANGVQAYANLRIPEHWDKNGKPDKFRKFKEEDFASCKTNIARLICTLAEAVVDGYTGKNADAGSVGLISLMGDDSPLDDILEATKSIGKIIGVITKTVTDFANLKIPTGFSKDGKATGYHQLKIEDITTMRDNILSILTELPKAIVDAYNGTDGKSYYSDGKLNEKIEAIQNSLAGIGDLMHSIVSVIEVFDKNSKSFDTLFKHNKGYKGTVAEGLSIGYIIDVYGIVQELKTLSELLTGSNSFTLTYDKIDPISESIDNIGTLIEDISKLAKDIIKYEKDISDFVKKDVIKNIKQIIGDENTGIVSLVNNIKKFPVNKEDITQIENIVENFDTIDSAICSIISAVSNIQEYYADSEEAIKFMIDENRQVAETLDKIITIIGKVGISLTDENFKNIRENTSNTEDILKGLVAFKQLVISIAINVEGVENVLSSKYGQLNKFVTNDKYVELIENIVDKINAFQDIICGYNLIGSDTLEQALGNTKHAIKVIFGMAMFKSMIDNMITYTLGIKSSLNNNKSVIEAFVNNSDYEKLVENVVHKIGKINEILEEVEDFDAVVENVINVKTSVENLIILADKSYKVNPKSFDALINGIQRLSETLQKIKYSETFAKNVSQLDKYVRTVNSISLTKLNPLIELTKQMNALAKRMGNLDKLTDAIANALSGVLQELVKQIKHAEKTIKDADVLQKRRHQLINDSMAKIKGIMENPLVVEVKAAESENTEGGEGGTTSGGSSSSGGGAGSNPAENVVKTESKRENGPEDIDESANNGVPGVAPGHGNGDNNGGKKEAKGGTDYLLKQILNTLRSQNTQGRNRK